MIETNGQFGTEQIMPGWYYLFQSGKRVGLAGREKGQSPFGTEVEWWYLRQVADRSDSLVYDSPGMSGNKVSIEFRPAGADFPSDWADYAGPSPQIHGHIVTRYQ